MKSAIWCIGIGLAAFAGQGYAARAAVNPATQPVKAERQTIEFAATDQPGPDKESGSELRKREEQLEKLRKTYAKQLAKCQDGDQNACYDARITEGEIQNIAASFPGQPG
jgi:hypothetical protein